MLDGVMPIAICKTTIFFEFANCKGRVPNQAPPGTPPPARSNQKQTLSSPENDVSLFFKTTINRASRLEGHEIHGDEMLMGMANVQRTEHYDGSAKFHWCKPDKEIGTLAGSLD